MEQREKFSSRLGFILLSAGCAIGLGNVWRFPYVVGKYGGAAFVLIYLLFLGILGLPIMAMELSVGRASQKSAITSFHMLARSNLIQIYEKLINHDAKDYLQKISIAGRVYSLILSRNQDDSLDRKSVV